MKQFVETQLASFFYYLLNCFKKKKIKTFLKRLTALQNIACITQMFSINFYQMVLNRLGMKFQVEQRSLFY